MAARHDLAEEWLALLELFPTKDGLKLRVPIPDTAIIRDARILGWFHTSREGIVTRAAAHEVSSDALLHKLLGQQVIDMASNPFTYVAVAHYCSGVARLLRRSELQRLLIRISGPYEPAPQPNDDDSELPFCVQQYIPPAKDLRYIATYGGTDNITCTTFARKYSSRYTHPFDDPEGGEAPSPGPHPQPYNGLSSAGGAAQSTPAVASAQHCRPVSAVGASGGSAADEPRSLTSEEMLVESQLIALGLLDARDQTWSGGAVISGAAGSTAGGPPGSPARGGPLDHHAGTSGRVVDAIAPASKQIKAEVARAVQTIMSYVERAHGLRIQGLVAEFIKAPDGSILFIAGHAVQMDSRASRGRLGTFTERWADFLTGMGPTPAPRVPARKHGSPALLLRTSNGSEPSHHRGLLMTDRASDRRASTPLSPGRGGGTTDGAVLAGSAGVLQLVPRPGSAPAHLVFNRFNGGASGAGSAPSSAVNGHYTLRNAVSASRRGAGGNPTATPAQGESYPLWSAKGDGLPSESVVAALALELEAIKDRLQRQTDIAARAEAALHQLAASSQAMQASLSDSLASTRTELEVTQRARREAEQDADRLQSERAGVREQLAAAEDEADRLREELHRDRETLATSVRSAQIKEENMDSEVGRLRDENEELSRRLTHASRRLDEEQEVVEAVRAQLYDYKGMVQTMQAQMRRGKSTRNGVSASVGGGSIANMLGCGSAALNASMTMPSGGGGRMQADFEGNMDGMSDLGEQAGRPTSSHGGAGSGGGGGSSALSNQSLAVLAAASNGPASTGSVPFPGRRVSSKGNSAGGAGRRPGSGGQHSIRR